MPDLPAWPADLTAATPPELDAVFADLWDLRARAVDRIGEAYDSLHRTLRHRPYHSRGGMTFYDESREDTERQAREVAAAPGAAAGIRRDLTGALDRLAAARLAVAAVNEREAPGLAEWDRRGGWLRFFRCVHLHRTTSCPSLRPTSRIGWLPDLSGGTEAEAVATHGAILCSKSTCFPDAPVEWTRGLDVPADPNTCPGKTYEAGSLKRQGMSAYGTCSGCGTRQIVTSALKVRKHKRPKD